MYNEGISLTGDILDLGVDLDVIEKRGSFYNYGDQRLAQGRENAKAFLRENPDLAAEIEAKIRENFGLDSSRLSAAALTDEPGDEPSSDE
jgi:recombination protein RecA